MNLKDYLLEAKITDVMYHGRTIRSDKFDYSYVGMKGATDQEGPGFYFSTDKEEAKIYSSGGTIITAQPKFRKTISNKKRKANIKDIIKMITMAPDLEDTLSNWGFGDGRTSKQDAINGFVESIYQYNDNELEMFLSVWYDMYRDFPQDYVKNMTKIGFDAAIKDKHIIVYNPKSFDILDMEKI